MNLFEKLPENFFSVLSRKYKAVYSFSLLTLFETLKTYKTHIKKSDYINALREHGEEIMSLFDVKLDQMDDRSDEETVNYDVEDSEVSSKINYIFRKLVSTGWIEVENVKGTDYIFLPSYSIKMLQYISDLTSDTSLYIPLVHQSYSELAMEDEKEDDYMFRSLISANKNADELELNITLLHHSICVFGHKLTNEFEPNEVLRQHFDVFRSEVSDKIYHPMKTYDSLSLYAIPVVKILTKWQRDSRIMGKLVNQAAYDTNYRHLKASELHEIIYKMLQETINKFSRLSDSFDDIDKANANYVHSVQRKINFLSNSDKSIKGKLDTIIVELAKQIVSSPYDVKNDTEKIPLLAQASQTISLWSQGFINSNSLTMPIRRTARIETDPLPLEDEFIGDDSLMNEFLENEVNNFSLQAVEEFMLKAFGNRKIIETKDLKITSLDELVLLILGIVRAEFGSLFYDIEKIGETTKLGNFLVPNYRFTKKDKRI